MFGFGNKKPPQRREGNFLQWGVMLLVIYVMGADYISKHKEERDGENPVKTEQVENKAITNESADCGEETTVKYSSFNEDGSVVETDITKTFVIGNGDFFGTTLEKEVWGMKVGEKKDATISMGVIENMPETKRTYKIEMVAIKQNTTPADAKFCSWQAEWK